MNTTFTRLAAPTLCPAHARQIAHVTGSTVACDAFNYALGVRAYARRPYADRPYAFASAELYADGLWYGVGVGHCAAVSGHGIASRFAAQLALHLSFAGSVDETAVRAAFVAEEHRRITRLRDARQGANADRAQTELDAWLSQRPS